MDTAELRRNRFGCAGFGAKLGFAHRHFGFRKLARTIAPAAAFLFAGCGSVHIVPNLDLYWATPDAISYGSELTSAQLDATTSVHGTFTYLPPLGTILAAGSHVLSVTFVPADSASYQARSYAVNLMVNKAIPVVTWSAPPSISYGTPLDAIQLDAASTGIIGNFMYVPPAGTVLGEGTQTLIATFTPTDLQNYEMATARQTVTVTQSEPPVIISEPLDQSVVLGQPATFSVIATGQGALAYQWRKNSVYIHGATSSNYTTAVTKATDDGSLFSVVVTDHRQVTISATGKLVVALPPLDSYYVAMSGSDKAEGSQLAPFATLQRAQRAMQTSLIKSTKIEAGTYYLSSPLVLTDADQGETWQAVPGSTVVLSGGEVISEWTNEGNGLFSAATTKPVALDLTVAGVRQIPADRGYNSDRPSTSGWRVIDRTEAPNYSSTFKVLPADITDSVRLGAIVQLIDHCRWSDVFTRVLGVNTAENTITVAKQFDTGSSNGLAGSWRVLNDPADLSSTGQFAFDSAHSRIYLRPVNPEALHSDPVVVARLGNLVSLKRVAGITIRGLIFSDTTSDTIKPSGSWDASLAAITGENVSFATISGNTFLNTGKAIVFRGSSRNTIVGNDFLHVGVSGINLFSGCDHNAITNNVFKDIGQTHQLSYALSVNDSSFNLVDSNLIDGSGRWGIVFGPSGLPADLIFANTGNVFSNNIIRNTSTRTNDSGAIYGGAQTVKGYLNENLLITGNRIENVGGLVLDNSGTYAPGFAQGIYLDDHLSGVTVSNNVIESGSTFGVMLCHGCTGNTATNNVIVLQPAPMYDRGRYGSAFATGDMANNGTTRIDLLPSYFPEDIRTSTIVVRVSGQSYGNVRAAFNVEVDGVNVGTGLAQSFVSDYLFKVSLTPHQVHRIGLAFINGSDDGAATTSLHNLTLIVNDTAVSMAAPEANGKMGSYGFAAIPDDLMVTNFSVVQNIIYRNGGLSQDVYDSTSTSHPAYTDPNPGTINYNLFFENLSAAFDPIFGTHPLDADSVRADPSFANPSIGDYRIPPGSPAQLIGFSPSDVPLSP